MDGGPLLSTVDASAQPSTAPVSPSTSSSPPDPVLAHYTALFARLLEQVVSAGLTDALDGSGTTGEVEEWHNLRQHLVETFNSPEAYSEQARAGSAVAAAQSLLAQFKAVGARRLAVECLGEDRRVLMDTEGTSAASCGTVEMLGWLGAVQRAALNSQYGQELPLSNSRTELDGPPSNNQHYSTIHNGNHAFYQSAPPSSLQIAAAPPLTLDPSSLGLPAYQNGSSSFDYSHGLVSNGGFALAPARGAMPVKKKARPSLVASSSSNTSSAPPSKALAFANRMDDFNSSASSSHPIPSTSTAGPPSLAAINAAASAPPPPPPSFAPPPTAPKPKKPRSSAAAKPPRRTSDGVLKGRGVSEVYVPPPSQPRTGDSSRPQRKRKLPQHLTFEQSSDPMDEDEEPFAVASAVPAKAKGKARAKPTPPPQNPDEIDELASDYEEEVSQRSMSIDAGAPASVVSMPEEEEGRYPIGTAVMAKFPNYHFFPACILDPRSAPATTQGKRQKGSYLVKSIPTGADWRWILPEESHIRPITDEERAEIISGSYKVKPPKSWITWRHELVEAMELSTNPEALKDWASRPTDLEFRIAAERERKKAEKMISETGCTVAGVSTPDFPGDIPSCVACQPEWSNISSCAAAAPAFENWMNMLYSPLSFVDAIQCACTDTFGSAYPQCVDCFVQTNQCEQYLGVPSESNATSILDGVRQICGFGSALLGGVAASQTSAGLTYTYNGVPSQGYPTTTSIGVGGMDYGSAEGATSGAKTTRLGLVVVVAAVAGGALLVLGSV